MILFAYIGIGTLVFVYGLAKGALRFHAGPRWLRRLIIDERPH